MTVVKRLSWLVTVWMALAVITYPQTGPDQQGSSSGSSSAQGQAQDQQSADQGNATAPDVRDTRPLIGADVGIQIPGSGRAYLLPSFSFVEAGDTNHQLVPRGGTGVQTASIPEAHIELDRPGRRTDFTADYLGGALLFNSVPQDNVVFQTAGLTEKYTGRVWNLQLSDRFSYLPEASFGFAGLNQLGSFAIGAQLGLGGGLNQLNSFFSPGQSILTGQTGHYFNTVLGQAQYTATSRTSLTGVAAFETLSFPQANFTSGNDLILSGSLDHAFTARDTLSATYSFTALRFNGLGEAINGYYAQLGYGRRINGRLSLRLIAGPEITQIRVNTMVASPKLYLTALGELSYHLERSDFSLFYRRFVDPGSGVLAGALNSTLTGEWSRRVTQSWSGTLYGGYGYNASLRGSLGLSNAVFNYEYGGLRLNRVWGRSLTMFGFYNLQYQSSNVVFSIFGNTPGRVVTVHTFGVGLDFHSRPFGI